MLKLSRGILLLILISLPTLASASTIISNSVSVTANGGVGTTHVKTISNGEVIENTTISTTTPYHYESNYNSDDKTQTISTPVNNDLEKIEMINRLLALLAELRTLMAYYENLQIKQ